MSSEKKSPIRSFLFFSILFLLEVLMAYTPLGYFRTGGIEISFMMLPVAIGAICIGPQTGMWLGFAFGCTSFVSCLGRSDFGSAIYAVSPVLTLLSCVPTRMAAGLLTGICFRRLYAYEDTRLEKDIQDNDAILTLHERQTKHWPAFCISSACAALLNTLLFSLFVIGFFYSSDYMQGYATELGVTNPFSFFLSFVGMQCAVELIVISLFGTLISKRCYYYYFKKD